jgi:hypothetical protein
MGIRINNKQVNYSHRLAQIKQQVGYCIVEAFFVHGQAMGKHEFTTLTTSRT